MANIFINATEVCDVVFPLVRCVKEENSLTVVRFLGTGFIVGNKGFLITATHVVGGINIEELYGVAVFDNKYQPIGFEEIFNHPVEDVSVLKVKNLPWGSYITPSNTSEFSSCDYQLWGYPDYCTQISILSKSLYRPDLCYYQGQIVRRISLMEEEFTLLKGKNFFELNYVAHTGCSGSPLIKKSFAPNEPWKMIGVYIGNTDTSFSSKDNFKKFFKEINNNDYLSLCEDKKIETLITYIDQYSKILNENYFSYGIAVREDGIRDWLNNIDPSLYKY